MSDPTSSLEVDVGDVTNDSSDEQDQFQPTQAKRRRNSSISHAPPLSPSTQLINVKLEVISDSGGESTSGSVHSRSPSPAPRERRHRECAEIAKTKFKPELVKREPGHENEHTVESREGSCERNDCPVQKTCCLAVSADCLHTRTDLGARIFHHINRVEHICSICYDLVYKVAPYSTMYNEWKGKWAMESQCVPTLKGYIQDQLLPFWLRCVDCGKYRSVDSTEVTIESKTAFVCTNGCKEDEDHVVNDAREHSWIFSIAASPLLHNSPARYYLRGNYYFDEVGMSPIANDDEEYEGCTTRSYLIPFHIPDENTPLIAFCVRPDVMEYDERISFSEYTMEPVFYLGLRNLILSLWALNPFEYLTLDTVLEHVLCRGVAHIWYNEEAKRVYDFLNTKCLINYGILNIPKNIAKPLTTAASGKKKPLEVLIIGAGVSGLSAARQLRSLGANVKVLEAKNVSGGRMQDDWSLGVAVGMGAQLVTGVTNNPLIVMCEQLGVGYRPTSRECPLMDVHTGLRLDIKVDLLVAEHFDCVLDILASWKLKNKGPDGSLIVLLQLLMRNDV